MSIFLTLAYLFFIGSTLGWLLELLLVLLDPALGLGLPAANAVRDIDAAIITARPIAKNFFIGLSSFPILCGFYINSFRN